MKVFINVVLYSKITTKLKRCTPKPFQSVVLQNHYKAKALYSKIIPKRCTPKPLQS
ncbi:MAG: hypothetical protein KAI83_17105 [Thiomargarita sp.]|nr:hypothetical protein [Thiomargarita sp.]